MPKRKTVTNSEPVELVVEEPPVEPADYEPRRRLPLVWRLLIGAVVGCVLLVGSFELAYWDKVFPGVSADGLYLGGLSRDVAAGRLQDQIDNFTGHALPISYGTTIMRIPVRDLGATYDTATALSEAYNYGRQGSLGRRMGEQLRALLGRVTNISHFSYSQDKLEPYVDQISEDVATPAADATLTFNDGQTQVSPAQAGSRLDLGRLSLLINDRLARTDISTIPAPVYGVVPSVTTAELTAAAQQADVYIAGPVTLTYRDTSQTIDRHTIIGWLGIAHHAPTSFLASRNLADLYPAKSSVTLSLSHDAITAYVAALAAQLDQSADNAQLAMQGGQLSVVAPSQQGSALDQPGTVDAISAALIRVADDRTVPLTLKLTQPDVREDNLAQLGITDLLSEGITYFPGSTQARLTNVRQGAKRFNGVLLAPGEVFSFGKLLGDVGPETGYMPELVILGDHEEKQYGGGLCQVSSTAYRAALLAGLPIVERHNHSFAVSYYTAPFGGPGVDATIYYPDVDFKFKNDTGHYILIQTIMQGTTLRFDFYGTKAKYGQIRGPQFVTGSNDATQPSHTVFWRDTYDLAGNLLKTDEVNTYYKSSKDFPVQQQFN
ncbi:MAG TPA: VanW family protein [Candidatus Saccharimonas sp.]|nr:VanW family protein [Candidatus Saccharimonas sp.]